MSQGSVKGKRKRSLSLKKRPPYKCPREGKSVWRWTEGDENGNGDQNDRTDIWTNRQDKRDSTGYKDSERDRQKFLIRYREAQNGERSRINAENEERVSDRLREKGYSLRLNERLVQKMRSSSIGTGDFYSRFYGILFKKRLRFERFAVIKALTYSIKKAWTHHYHDYIRSLRKW